MLWLASHWPWFAFAAAGALVVCVPGMAAFLFGTKLGRVILVAALALGVGYWQRTDGYANGYRAAEKAQGDWKRAAALQVAQASLAESEANRKAEQARAGAIDVAAKAYERGKADANAAVAGVLGAVERGDYVLRASLHCPARSPAGEAAASPGVSDGPGPAPAVLSAADVQFLVRFAGDADAVSEQLRACQAVVNADRAVLP